MAKNSITDYSKTAASNTDIQSVDIDEGCLPSGINNAIRELMADLAAVNDGTVALTSPSATALDVTNNVTVGGTVDGRDVAADGTKLDGVEAAADVTDTANVASAGAAMLTGATFTGGITAPDATFNGNTAIALPSGTDAQRPTPANGMLRYNSDDAQFEGYADGEWGAIAGGGETSLLNYNYTATAGQTTFSGADDNSATLSYTASNIVVTLNGVVLEGGTDYTASNGTSVVLTDGAVVNDELNIIAFKTFTVADTVAASTGGTFAGNVAMTSDLTVDTNTLHVDSANNRVGIGTTSPARELSIGDGTGSPNIQLLAANTGNSRLEFGDTDDSDVGEIQYLHGDNAMLFHVNASERVRIDSSGNVLAGMTSGIGTFTNSGVGISSSSNYIHAIRDGNIPLFVGRKTSDGEVIRFYKDGTTVGSIGIESAYGFYIDGEAGHTGLQFAANSILPRDNGSRADNIVDLGASSLRFDDIYATNGTIQTSDQNEKQQIASLTAAEITAAKAISALFKTFKWNDSVTENGDNARTHTGVIAQDVQQAMTDAGLDAGDYAFFISATWWETSTDVPAVAAVAEVLDDDGNVVTEAVEAQDAYTRVDTYDTQAEAPEGATERTRLGIRYPELLAFVGAATEQRLADIETRIAALEAE